MNFSPCYRCSLIILSSCFFLENLEATTITSISAVDNSSNRSIGSLTSDYGERWTQSNVMPVTSNENTVSFSHQMQSYTGFFVPENGSSFGLSEIGAPRYQLFFTIEDPTNIGYDLRIDTIARGYSTAILGSGTMNFFAGSMTLGIDTNTSDGISFGNTRQGAWASSADIRGFNNPGYVSKLGEDSDSEFFGSFSGTRSFGLSLEINNSLLFQNNTEGQASARFGLPNINPVLDSSGKPQSGDIYSEDDLGHFTTVNAVFHSNIPEPSSLLMLGLSGFFMAARRYRRQF